MDNLNKITFSNLDTIVVYSSIILLIVSWLYVIVSYNDLPETIVLHFNGAGEPDGYSNKNSVWFSPILFTALTFLMLYGAKNPIQFDISHQINTKKQAVASSKTLLFAALLLSFVLLMIVYSTVNASIPNANNYKWVFRALIISIVIYLVLVFSINLKLRKKQK